MIIAGVCIVVAGFFLLRREFTTAFVIAVLGLVAWFLNYRAQMKEAIAAIDLEESRRQDEEQNFADSDEN